MYNIPIFPFRSFFVFLVHNILHFIHVLESYSNYLQISSYNRDLNKIQILTFWFIIVFTCYEKKKMINGFYD